MVAAAPRHWLINGCGCAAASIKRGLIGDSSMDMRAAGPAGPRKGTLVTCSVTPLPAVAVGRLGAGVPGAAPRGPDPDGVPFAVDGRPTASVQSGRGAAHRPLNNHRRLDPRYH